MPWVVRESQGRRARARRAMQRWAYDHSQGLTALAIGAASACATLIVVLKLLPV